MATPLGTSYFTNEEVVAQSDTKLIGSKVETLVVEFNQARYEALLSAGDSSLKTIKRGRKVSTTSTISLSLSNSEEESSQEDGRKFSKKIR